MPRTRNPKTPQPTDMVGLVNADELRWYIQNARYPRDDGYTDARIAEIMKLSAGFVGMVLSGTREPSRKFLKAAGFERVVLYRMKGKGASKTRRDHGQYACPNEKT